MRIFEPDIFSSRIPLWMDAEAATSAVVCKVLQLLDLPECATVQSVEKSCALEINSGNFRITTSTGQYLLKRWDRTKTEVDIRKTLGLLIWLQKNSRLPVSHPLTKSAEPLVLDHLGEFWSVFRFVPAEYYDGRLGQLEAAASTAARLHAVLAEAPREWISDSGPLHGTVRDQELFRQVNAQRRNWGEIFGNDSARLLSENWSTVETAWEYVLNSRVDAGVTQLAHFDLHPHNILMSGTDVAAVIDFDSCKPMQVGYALAFAGLKLCRQTVSIAVGGLSAAEVGHKFLQTLGDSEPRYAMLTKHFTALSLAEVLRRIGIILRMNLDNSDRTWNHVLPVQVRHIGEAQALFGDL